MTTKIVFSGYRSIISTADAVSTIGARLRQALLSVRFSLIDGFAFVSIIALVVQAPALLHEDITMLNYVVNVQNPHVLYLYNDYIQVIPQVTAYLLKSFPLVMQGVLYRVVPLAVIIVLYRELEKLFSFYSNKTEAQFLALAVIFFMRFVEPLAIALLCYTIWSAFFAAFVHILRKQIEQSNYSIIGFFGISIAALSQSLAILLVPILLSDVRSTKTARNVVNMCISALIVGWAALEFFMGLHTTKLTVANPGPIYDAFVFWFHNDFKLQIVLIVLSILALSATLVTAFVSAGHVKRQIRFSLILFYFGVGSFIFYLASPRFLSWLDSGAFQPRYIFILTLCALIAVILAILGVKKAELHPILVGSIFGFCLALTTMSIYPSVTGAIKDAARRYEFLSAAAQFRSHCGAEEVIAYQVNQWFSLVVFCNRRDFPEGWSTVTEFKTWDEQPGTGAVRGNGYAIYSGKPLL